MVVRDPDDCKKYACYHKEKSSREWMTPWGWREREIFEPQTCDGLHAMQHDPAYDGWAANQHDICDGGGLNKEVWGYNYTHPGYNCDCR